MITPRATHLIGVQGLQPFRETVLRLIDVRSLSSVRQTAVLVPTRSAGEHLRRALEDASPAPGSAVVIPHLVTRSEWLERLRASLPALPQVLSPHEREVILEAAARATTSAGFAPPFRLRPGHVGEMLALYDALRRHGRSVDDLERTAGETFTPSLETDHGAARMLEQAQFLSEAFRGYERRVAEGGRADEHVARELLLAASDSPFRHVIVAAADAAVDPGGLWPSDFDLLTRINGLARIDIVATEASLAAGLLPRLRRWLPNLAEVRDQGAGSRRPALVVPPDGSGRRFAQHRDREEEVAAIARSVRAGLARGSGAALSRTGVVFRRPLPYVYLAAQVFRDAALPYDTFDALPLAAEPYAAALDLVIECVESGFSREAVTAVLRSPHFAWTPDGPALRPRDVAALDRALSDARFLGGAAELVRLTGEWERRAGQPDAPSSSLMAAARAAAGIARALAPVETEARPAEQIDLLLRFLDRFDSTTGLGDRTRDRSLRARAAVRGVLAGLREAHLAWNDDPCAFADTVSRIRRWIEDQTFSPSAGEGGLQLLDAQAARFARLDRVYLAGLVQPDWPGARRRNIFFPASFLRNLGWPDDDDVRAAARSEFEDLVSLAESRVSVSSFLLDHDTIVEPSTFLDELDTLGLTTIEDEPVPAGSWLLSEALERGSLPADLLPESTRGWVALRAGRTPASDPRFHGRSDGAARAAYRVSAIDRYLDCPFRYFAADVLRLAEEPEDEESLSPRTRGKLAHDALQRFFDRWQRSGRGAITVENLPDARRIFAQVVEELASTLPAADAALQRASLLGSPVAVGVGEIVFQVEIGRPGAVVERLLEFSLDGDTELRCGFGTRVLALRARADRVDLLDDGTFRLVDYKLSRAPKPARAVQLPAYAAAVRSKLAGHRGRDWVPTDAGYVTFGKPPNDVPVSRSRSSLDADLACGEARLVDAVEHIERGVFPPAPADRHECTTCPFPGVCRKDYVEDP
ncbi:MAG: PD-(D/E)XK nuclease family protein [Acidobacteriota bacterium]